MLAGQKAFRGESITALIFKIITEEPPPLRELDPTVPDAMLRIIAQGAREGARDPLPDRPRAGRRPPRAHPAGLRADAARGRHADLAARRAARRRAHDASSPTAGAATPTIALGRRQRPRRERSRRPPPAPPTILTPAPPRAVTPPPLRRRGAARRRRRPPRSAARRPQAGGGAWACPRPRARRPASSWRRGRQRRVRSLARRHSRGRSRGRRRPVGDRRDALAEPGADRRRRRRRGDAGLGRDVPGRGRAATPAPRRRARRARAARSRQPPPRPTTPAAPSRHVATAAPAAPRSPAATRVPRRAAGREGPTAATPATRRAQKYRAESGSGLGGYPATRYAARPRVPPRRRPGRAARGGHARLYPLAQKAYHRKERALRHAAGAGATPACFVLDVPFDANGPSSARATRFRVTARPTAIRVEAAPPGARGPRLRRGRQRLRPPAGRLAPGQAAAVSSRRPGLGQVVRDAVEDLLRVPQVGRGEVGRPPRAPSRPCG